MESQPQSARPQVLPLEMIGTKVGDLVKPCSQPYKRHDDPPLPAESPAFAVALSGGGFRATLSGIGVLRFLADAGLLGRVRHVSSVSGGSIAGGLFANAYPKLEAAGFSTRAFVEQVEKVAIDHIAGHNLTLKLLRNVWRTIGPGTRTTLLAWAFDDWFFHQLQLADLSPSCRFIFNA